MDKSKQELTQVKKIHPLDSLKKQGMTIVAIIDIFLLLINILLLYLLPNKVKEVIQARSEVLAQELQTQSAHKIISDINAYKEREEIIYSSLPTKSMVLKIIEFLEQLGTFTKSVNFSFESEEPKRNEQGYSYLPITLELEGKLSETMNALERIKNSPYLFVVKQTLIESPNGLGENNIVHVSLELYVRQPFKDN